MYRNRESVHVERYRERERESVCREIKRGSVYVER